MYLTGHPGSVPGSIIEGGHASTMSAGSGILTKPHFFSSGFIRLAAVAPYRLPIVAGPPQRCDTTGTFSTAPVSSAAISMGSQMIRSGRHRRAASSWAPNTSLANCAHGRAAALFIWSTSMFHEVGSPPAGRNAR